MSEHFKRFINYYETDKMGVVHHANYVHYLEEARVYFLSEHDFSYVELEKRGIFSPTTHVDISYKNSCTYGDIIDIEIRLIRVTPVRFVFRYLLTDEKTGKVIATAETEHCFSDSQGRLLILSRREPELAERFSSVVESDEQDE